MFLVGDAVHLMPPNGGFGGNTGIADAYDLAWKLAYVLDGRAGPELLEELDVLEPVDVRTRRRSQQIDALDEGEVLVARSSLLTNENLGGCSRKETIGRIADEETDRRLRALVTESLGECYTVLYVYLPNGGFPLTNRCLRDSAGIEVVPDRADGLPVWTPATRRPGMRPSYLLFTVFSSVVK